MAPQKRPHYLPTERMAILQLRTARGWSVPQTTAVFHVTALTITDWILRLETKGRERFVALAEPVNKFPDFVRQAVKQVKSLCPRQGIQCFDKRPTSREVREFLSRTTRRTGAKPRYLVVDIGVQFWSRGLKSWCRSRSIRPRFGAVGQRGSLALIERLIHTLKKSSRRA